MPCFRPPGVVMALGTAVPHGGGRAAALQVARASRRSLRPRGNPRRGGRLPADRRARRGPAVQSDVGCSAGPGRRDRQRVGEALGRAVAAPVPAPERRVQRDGRSSGHRRGSVGPQERASRVSVRQARWRRGLRVVPPQRQRGCGRRRSVGPEDPPPTPDTALPGRDCHEAGPRGRRILHLQVRTWRNAF
ncbi:unnamed protein product [Ectocarpus sp. 12 AP-2014]